MVALHTTPAPQATANHLAPFLDCDPSIQVAALGCPKKMMLFKLERSAIKVLICFTDEGFGDDSSDGGYGSP
jgi:hypothetical protein